MVAGLVVDTELLAEREKKLQQIMDEFDRVWKRRRVKVKVAKSKVMVFQRPRDENIKLAKPYRGRPESMTK